MPDIDGILSNRKAEAAFLGSACLLAILYRGASLVTELFTGIPTISHVSYDGVYYVQIARNILSGDGLGWEAMVFPVLQPILTAALSLVTGIKNLSYLSCMVSMLSGAALLVPVYLLVKDIYGRKAAAAAVLVLIPYPHLFAISTADTTESLYTFLVFLSTYLGYRALSGAPLRYTLYTGLSFGLTYLARPEGLIVFAAILPLAAWRLMALMPRREALKGLGLLIAGFLIFAMPYFAFLTKSYGRVVLSSKLPYESVVMKNKVLGEQITTDEVEGITPSGNIAWRERGGAGLIYGYFKQDPARFIKIYLGNLASELPWEVRNSSHLAGYPIVYPVYIWAAALLGFVLLIRQPGSAWKALLLWAPFVNLFVYAVFTKGFWIYHAPYVPALVTLALGGVLFISGQIDRRLGVAVPLLLVLVSVWAAYSMYVRFSAKPEQVKIVSYKTAIADEELKVGTWGRAEIGTKVTYMMDWSRLVYYLGGRWVNIPSASPRDIIGYGVRNNVDYIVEEMRGDDIRMGSRFKGAPGVEFVHLYSCADPQFIVIFWKLDRGYEGRQGT